MALTANIVERTVGGETDKRFQLAGGAYTRTIKEGSSWNKLRIGIRLSTTRDSAWTSPPKFYFGLCSGTTAPPGSITPNHFLGISNQGENASNFNWGNSTDYITWGSKWSQPIIIENGAQRSACDGGQASASYNIHKSDKGRIAWFLEFTKGATWTLEGRGPLNLSIANQVTLDYFRDAMQEPSPMSTDTQSKYDNTLVSSSASPFTVDEATYGNLDTMVFSWIGDGVDSAFEIHDIDIRRLD